MSNASQNTQIKQALEKGEKLTALDALRRFGCLRLSGRIYDLRHQFGMAIKSSPIEIDGKRVSQYSVMP